MTSNKLLWGQNVTESSIESPWRFLAGLDYKHGRQIRRIMAMVSEHIGRKQKVTSQNRWQRLHRHQRVSIHRMLRETKGNYLLYDILDWFAGHLKGTSRETWDAMQMLRNKTIFYARYRKTYYQEYKKAKKEWKAFRGASWNSERDGDEDTEDEEMGEAGGRRRPRRKTLEDKLRRMVTYKIQYVREDDLVNQENVLTEAEDSDNDDLDDDDTEEEVNIFKEVPKTEGRTRSGYVRHNEVWEEFPTELPDTEKIIPSPKKRKPERTIVVDTGSFGMTYDMDESGYDEMELDNVTGPTTMNWLAQSTATPPKAAKTKTVTFADDLPENQPWNTNPMDMRAAPRSKNLDFGVTPTWRAIPKPGPKGGQRIDFGPGLHSGLFASSETPTAKTPKTPTTTSTNRPSKKKQKNSPYHMTSDLFSTPVPHKRVGRLIKREEFESQLSSISLSGASKKRTGGGRKRKADSEDSEYMD